MIDHAHRIEQWDRYWAYGNLHSFSQVHPGNYRGAIAALWQDVFAHLPDDSRVIDIATGNGAIPLLALDAAERAGRHLRISAFDLATIDPFSQIEDEATRERLRAVDFHPRVPAEQLPLADAVADLACSQFGIEYSDLDRSIAELGRVVRPGGGVALVTHHRGSIFLAHFEEEATQIDFVMNELKLYLKTRNLLRAMADAGGVGARTPKVVKKRKAVDEALKRVQQAAQRTSHPDMLVGPARYVREILEATPRTAPSQLLQWLDEARERVLAQDQRMRDMHAAARTDEDIRHLRGLLETVGFTDVATEPLRQSDGSILGWCVTARRS